jgi:hypothetical protein
MDKKHFKVALPDEVIKGFGWQGETETEMPRRVLEALVMELLRLDRLSEGEAAQILGINNRWDLFDTMGSYEVPVIRFSSEELEQELSTPIRRRE